MMTRSKILKTRRFLRNFLEIVAMVFVLLLSVLLAIAIAVMSFLENDYVVMIAMPLAIIFSAIKMVSIWIDKKRQSSLFL